MTLKQAKEVIKTLEGDLDAAEPISNEQLAKQVEGLTEKFANQETNVAEEELIKAQALDSARKKFDVKTFPINSERLIAFDYTTGRRW